MCPRHKSLLEIVIRIGLFLGQAPLGALAGAKNNEPKMQPNMIVAARQSAPPPARVLKEAFFASLAQNQRDPDSKLPFPVYSTRAQTLNPKPYTLNPNSNQIRLFPSPRQSAHRSAPTRASRQNAQGLWPRTQSLHLSLRVQGPK